jgi:hypothetical protein
MPWQVSDVRHEPTVMALARSVLEKINPVSGIRRRHGGRFVFGGARGSIFLVGAGTDGTEVFGCIVPRAISVNHASWPQKVALVLTEHACNIISLIMLTTAAGYLPDSHEFTKSQSLPVTPAMLRLFRFRHVTSSPSSLTLYFTQLVPHKSDLCSIPKGFAGPIRVRIRAKENIKKSVSVCRVCPRISLQSAVLCMQNLWSARIQKIRWWQK